MCRTIMDLWNGNIVPIRYFGMNNSEMKELEQKMGKSIELLEDTLNTTEEKLFKNYYDLVNEYLAVSNGQAFCDGFSVGIKFFVEAISNSECIL